MAEAASKSESMEDILQSIKRIIEDDSISESDPKAVAPGPAAEVLELTQVVKEDGSLGSSLPPAVPAPAPIPSPQSTPAPQAKAAAPVAPPPAPKPAVIEEGLVSDQAAQAAAAALRPITEGGHKDYSIPHIPSSSLRNGHTVEDLVLEALKPMLKAWLDEHLPLIVQKIVEKEVKRIVTFHND